MVQKLGNSIEYLNSKKNLQSKADTTTKAFFLNYNRMKNYSNYDLLDILKTEKNKVKRHVAVYLLGKTENINQEILNHLREMVLYESSIIRKEVIWALAKLGDASVQSHLLKLIDICTKELDISISTRLLGYIGDEKVLPILLTLFGKHNSIISYSAGLAIYEIINKNNIEIIIEFLKNKSRIIKLSAIWILGFYLYINPQDYHKKKAINILKFHFDKEKDSQIKISIAYILTILNSPEGVKRLIMLYFSEEIPKVEQAIFWNEITRFFIYSQKQASLKIKRKINRIMNSRKIKADNNQQLCKMLLKLEQIIENLDQIFEYC